MVYCKTLQILWRLGGKKADPCFFTSPLLFLLYTFYHSFTLPPHFSRSPSSLHYFIVSQCRFQCLAFLSAASHTGPPPVFSPQVTHTHKQTHGNTPSTCLPSSYMSSRFPNPVQQTSELGSRLAWGDLQRYNSETSTSIRVWFTAQSTLAQEHSDIRVIKTSYWGEPSEHYLLITGTVTRPH